MTNFYGISLLRYKIVPQPVMLASEKDIMLGGVTKKKFFNIKTVDIILPKLLKSSCKTSGRANKSMGESQDLPESTAE